MMKCWEFRELVGDLSYDRPMDDRLRVSAAAHAESCEPCGQQLSAQRRLNRGLQAYAEETGTLRASSRVRERLRAVVAESPAPVVSINDYRKRVGRVWFLAAAAALLAICSVSILLWQRTSTPSKNAQADATAQILAPSPTQAPPEPAKPTSPIAQRDVEGLKLGRLPRTQTGSRPRSSPRAVRASEDAANKAETVSEFVPLTLAADEKAIENGTIVRIKAPRAQLVAMGLPLRVENEAETINADIMLGDNGVAYAIRVVRE